MAKEVEGTVAAASAAEGTITTLFSASSCISVCNSFQLLCGRRRDLAVDVPQPDGSCIRHFPAAIIVLKL